MSKSPSHPRAKSDRFSKVWGERCSRKNGKDFPHPQRAQSPPDDLASAWVTHESPGRYTLLKEQGRGGIGLKQPKPPLEKVPHLHFESLGRRTFKNISERVEVLKGTGDA